MQFNIYKGAGSSPRNLELNTLLKKICCAFCLLAATVAPSGLFASDIKEKLPIAGGLHLQEHGWAGISFFYSVSDLRENQVKIQISTSSQFNKIMLEFAPKGRSYFWRCEMTGKIYWRLVLQAKDGRTLATTPVKFFVVVPPPVATTQPSGDEPQTFSTRGLDFQWSEGKPHVIFYRFKLARDRSFDQPLINVDTKEWTYHLNALKPGQYFWKVGVKYSWDIPIVYGAIRELNVGTPSLPTPITVEAETEEETSTDKTPLAKIEAESSSQYKKPITPGSRIRVESEVEKPSPSAPAENTPPVQESPPPSPVDLLQPSDQALIETLEANKSVILQWLGSEDARTFVVEMAQDGSFTDASLFKSDQMRLSVKLPIGSWFWRVTAVAGNGKKSAPSISRNFSIVAKKIKIELISPEDNREFQYGKRAASVVFAWRMADSGVESFTYRLQVARDNQWHDIYAHREVSSESLTMDDLSEGRYFWRVGVQTTKDSPIFYSDVRQFLVQKKRASSTPPKLTQPYDGAKMTTAGMDLPVSLQWDAPDGSRGFIIELANDPSFVQTEVFNSLTPAIELTRKPGNFFWRVRALDGSGDEGPFSEVRSFSITKASESIRLVEPAADAAIHSFKVDFRWQALPGCISYGLSISLNNTMDNPIKELSTKDTMLQSELDDEDVYFWQVRCNTEDGRAVKSIAQSFRIVIND